MSTHLTGRHKKHFIFPFSFEEIIKYENKELDSEIFSRFDKYIEQGGYPEVLFNNMGFEYLRDLVDATILKDIVFRYNIKFPEQIEKLFLLVVSNFSQPLSYNKIKNILGVGNSNTVEKYITYLENSFLIFRLSSYSHKIKKQILSQKKLFFYDLGIAN